MEIFFQWKFLSSPLKSLILYHLLDKSSHGTLLLSYRNLLFTNKEINNLLTESIIWTWVGVYFGISGAKSAKSFFSRFLKIVPLEEYISARFEFTSGKVFRAEEYFVFKIKNKLQIQLYGACLYTVSLVKGVKIHKCLRISQGVLLVTTLENKASLYIFENQKNMEHSTIELGAASFLKDTSIAYGWHGAYLREGKFWIFRLWNDYMNGDFSKDKRMSFKMIKVDIEQLRSTPTIFGADILEFVARHNLAWDVIYYHPIKDEIIWHRWNSFSFSFIVNGFYLYERLWCICDLMTGERLIDEGVEEPIRSISGGYITTRWEKGRRNWYI